ncbi:MAG: ROK family protein [bacterium]|nr:ROK family protein [bacterium]
MEFTADPATTNPAPLIGIDVGGTAIKYGIVDGLGRITHTGTRPTPTSSPEITAALTEIAADLDATGIDPRLPAGVAVPGIVDEERGIGVWSANLGWRDAPLAAEFSKALGREVALGHDVRCGAIAEAEYTDAGPDLFFVAIGTGISAALVLGGRHVITGGWAGEIGQYRVEHEGELVPLEKVASSAAIARTYSRITGQTVAGAKEVFEAPDAREIIADALSHLGEVLAASASTLGPVPIRIGGAAVRSGEDLFGPLRAELTRRLPEQAIPTITAAELGASAQVVGAATLARRRIPA